MAATRISTRGWVLSLLTVALVASAGGRPFASDTNPSLDSLKAVEQKTLSLVPPLVEATVGLSIVDGPGMGSGVIVSEDGLIMTAGHVVPASGKEMIVYFNNGKRAKAKALGADKYLDTGMAQITDKGKWPYVKVGKSSELKKGDWIMAIGNPGGFRPERRPPIRIGRVLNLPDKKANLLWIQTDATVAPGDSGGPLFNLNGEVVGIHSNISPSPTENRHVASDDYLAHWEQLKSGKQTGNMFGVKQTRRAELGIQPEDVDGRVEIGEVSPKSAADEAGLKTGDVILSIDGDDISKADEVRAKLRRKRSGSEVVIKFERDGEKKEAKAKLRQGPYEFKDPPEELETFLSKHGYRRPDGTYEYKPTEETEPDFKKIMAKFGDQRLRMMGAPRVDPNITKTAPQLFEGVSTLSKPVSKSVVTIYSTSDESKILAYGTVVSKDGYVLTKASELKGEIFCKVNGKEYDAHLVTKKDDYDLALVKVDAESLSPVTWSSQSDPTPGSLLVTPNYDGKPLALGVVSNAVREIGSSLAANKAVLGVSFKIGLDDEAPEIETITPNGPAAKAGLKKGDVIISIDGKKVSTRQKTQEALKPKQPGDKIKIEVRRDDETLTFDVTLASRQIFNSDPNVQERMRPFSQEAQRRAFDIAAHISKRKEDFPAALTHDSALRNNQCGGPIVNLAGQVIGVNIARFDRTGSYALTYQTLKPILDQMLKDAAKPQAAKTTSDKGSE